MKLQDLKAGCIRDALERRAAPAAYAPAIRARRGTMNKWEQSFADEVLAPRKRAGEITDWRFESVKLFAGVGQYYTPDFMSIDAAGRITFWEVKGLRREAGVTKFKAAAGFWPCWTFVFVTRGTAAGSWSYTTVGAEVAR